MKTFISLAVLFVFSVSLMAQTATLKLNLEQNKTYRVKSTSEQNTTINMGGTPRQAETKSYIMMSLKPVSVSPDFIMADIRFDTIITTVSSPKMEMNSNKTGNYKSSDFSEAVSYFLNKLSNTTFNIKLAPTGNVIEITNIRTITGDLLKGVDSVQGPMSSMVQAQIKMMISETGIKGMIESITAYLPGKQVQVGDKWESHISVSAGGMGLLMGTNYKLKKITGNQAEISAENTMEPANQVPVEMNGAEISYDVRGLGKSTLLVDTKTGWIIKISSKNHNQGNMNIKAQGNDMQMPMEIEGTTEIVNVP